MNTNSLFIAAADRIEKAVETGETCAPVRDLIGSEDLSAAYAVQQVLTARRLDAGATIVGRKIGLTSAAVQQQLGVHQPDFGVLFDAMDVSAVSGDIPMAGLLQPKIEAEVAFILGSDLDDELTPEHVRAAVAYAAPALEVVDSRVAGWDIRITDTIADNASSGLFVLGDERVTLDHLEPADVTMTMFAGDTVASEGNGAACLGDPLNALLWLARTAHSLGEPLRAGQVILSGALGPMVAVTAGLTVRAEISGLGQVSATFAKET